MSEMRHERPGVYSVYDASSVTSAGRAAKRIGVAALALGKGCRALNQNGLVFTGQNMDQLLFERYVGQKVRRAGRRTQGPGKRTAQQDAAFRQALAGLLPCQ